MKKLSLPGFINTVKSQIGFTMIELLIVISILGILAVAVLSAINPIEQINRGRDTGSQSDAEQLINAVDRYYAYNGTYPWQGTGPLATQNDTAIGWAVFDGSVAGSNGDNVSTELLLKDELKESFMTRVTAAANPLSIFNAGVNSGDSTYVCFNPASRAFQEQATARCDAGLPADLTATEICQTPGEELYCLP